MPQPISACYSEAPTWKYFGEVDAQNKFQGRSFEIRPTGVAHAELIIPKKWVKEGLDYPDAGPEYGEDYVVEHYSCVFRSLRVVVLTGLIGGRKSPRMSPTSSWVRRSLTITAISLSVSDVADLLMSGCNVDLPANHRTGETCTLTFKPRSWRGRDAFEIKGSVQDSAGRAAWDIAGRE